MTKKPERFKIGVFTVFLVVMVITMLKSVVDSSPILFVKIGQDQVGAIDYTLRASSDGALRTVPLNYYSIDPFEGLFGGPALSEVPESENASKSDTNSTDDDPNGW